MWRDNWIPRPFSYKPISPQGRCRILFVSNLLNDNGSWNYGLLSRYFLAADVHEILKIRASPRLVEDVLAWGPEKRGIFSVKSAYSLAFDLEHHEAAASSSSSQSGSRACWSFIWKVGLLLQFGPLRGV